MSCDYISIYRNKGGLLQRITTCLFSIKTPLFRGTFQTEIWKEPHRLRHPGDGGYGIDELYLVVSIRNRSAVSYELSEQRFAIESLRRRRQGLQMERAVFPKQVYGLGLAQPGGYERMVFAFDKITLTRGQVLRVYLYEDGGARNYVVEIGRKDVEGARRL